MLEDVVNELDLSDDMIIKHGPLGTAPSELVRLILEQKDLQIRLLTNNETTDITKTCNNCSSQQCYAGGVWGTNNNIGHTWKCEFHPESPRIIEEHVDYANPPLIPSWCPKNIKQL